jgi:23S rRNA (adenine2503-C2)-methyltransferase
MTTSEIVNLIVSLGQPAFRGRQIAKWLYERDGRSIAEMSDLPASLRQLLSERASLVREEILATHVSDDGTKKFLLGLGDGESVEAVLLPYEDRVSTCISSQVGCAAGCTFCATGKGGLRRNLTAGEIVDEVLTMQSKSDRRISHVVYMGMGEPLLNLPQVLKSVFILNSEVGIAMRHITLSTVGIIPEIYRLAEENLQLTLAVSLHAPNDELRRRLIPMADRYPLSDLMIACRKYGNSTGRSVTFEYMLIQGVNDSMGHAAELARLVRKKLCSVNLIPFNPVEGVAMRRPSSADVRAFAGVLKDAGVTVTQRMERGKSISAACGQLRRRISEE